MNCPFESNAAGVSDLISNLIDAARMSPERPAVKLDDDVLTYQGLYDSAASVAGLLQHLGMAPGDRVALVLPNVTAFPVLLYGSLLAGCAVLPLNPQLKRREIEYCLSDSGTKLVFAWERGADASMSAAQSTGAKCLLVGAAGLTAEQFSDTAPIEKPIARCGADNAVILYSAGITGKPMGAQLTHHNLGSNAATCKDILLFSRDSVVMGCLPLFHVFGMTAALNASIAAEACLTLIPRFHPLKALEVISRDRVTSFLAVPTMYSALLKTLGRGEFDVSSLQLCVTGGSAMPVQVMKDFETAFGCIVLEGYGLSETSPVATFNHADAPRKPGSIGTPVAGMELKLIDHFGSDIPLGVDEVGEIAIRGDGVMKGYWERPEATERVIPDGWFRSGDLAARDADGYYFIVGRKKDMIIRGGYNVYPQEVEDALAEHEAVAEVAVFGVEHADLGEEVCASVVLEADAHISIQELQSFARERVADYKCPRHIWIVEDLPKDSAGKILRRGLVPSPDNPPRQRR